MPFKFSLGFVALSLLSASQTAVSRPVARAAADATPCAGAVTVTVTGAAAAPTSAAASNSSIGNFGSCSVPQIIFAVGLDGRKETAFEPADLKSYNHGSADNIDIITQFICDQLTNSCGADATAKATCAQAQAAADTATPKTGAQADNFNAVFGITTNFAAVAEVDDQGNIVAGTGDASSTASSASSSASSAAPAAVSSSAAVSTAAASSIGNFGSCSIPQINFGTGFDNRKETAFEPADQKSYDHGSADNIDIITQFICDQLTNSCGADATAKATCAQAQAAADTATPKTGAQADNFNAVFGITTNFAAVAEVDDQGNIVAGTGDASSTASSASSAASSAAPAAASSSAAVSTAAASNIGNFGSCSVPQINFGTGFDNRKETAFEPADQKSYDHGSADNIAVISNFICLALTNTCGADQTAKATCATAQAAANAATPLTGAQADAFNAAFGIKTNFASVAVVDNTGNVVSSTGSA